LEPSSALRSQTGSVNTTIVAIVSDPSSTSFRSLPLPPPRASALATALFFCAPNASDAWRQSAWVRLNQAHFAITSTYATVCSNTTWTVLNASLESLEHWWARVVVALLRRRGPTKAERSAVRKLLQPDYWWTASMYRLLTLTLHRALLDPTFMALVEQQRGMWLDLGVFRGLSANITSRVLEIAAPGQAATVVNGFDTFTGLPEAWRKRVRPNGGGPLNVYLQQGAFSWAKEAARRGLGPTPPVHPRVTLHPGLIGTTLPEFLRQQPPTRPLAWANVDVDLYSGTRDALYNLGPRLRAGSRLHFHELLKLPDINRATDRLRTSAPAHREPGNAVPPSDEGRALFEWLRAEPGVALQVDDTQSLANPEAVVLTVLREHHA
jgi:hypothetical protein